MDRESVGPHRLEPHEIERAGALYEVRFEWSPEAWLCHIRREGREPAHTVAFPHGPGYAADDARASLIAGCEAAIETIHWERPTRH